MTTEIFDENAPSSKATDQAPSTEVSDSDTLELVGEGKKYKSLKDLENGHKHANDHIKTLEQENEELRQKLEEAKKIDDVIDALHSAPKNAEGKAVDVKGLLNSLKPAIKEQIQITLQDTENATREQTNAQMVVSAVKAKFGEDKAKSTFEGKALELGIDIAELDRLAKTSPKAVLALFEIQTESNEQKVSTTTQRSSAGETINTASFTGKPKTYKDDPRYLELAKKGDVEGIIALSQSFKK